MVAVSTAITFPQNQCLEWPGADHGSGVRDHAQPNRPIARPLINCVCVHLAESLLLDPPAKSAHAKWQQTKRSAVLRTWGMAMLISPADGGQTVVLDGAMQHDQFLATGTGDGRGTSVGLQPTSIGEACAVVANLSKQTC